MHAFLQSRNHDQFCLNLEQTEGFSADRLFQKGLTKKAYIAMMRLRRPKWLKGCHSLPLETSLEPSQAWLKFNHSFDKCPAHSCEKCTENSTAKQGVRISEWPW